MNYIDLIIIGVLIFFLFEARRLGFWIILVDFFSFLASLVIALIFYGSLADLLKNHLQLGRSISNAIGFLILSIIAEGALVLVLTRSVSKIPEKFKRNKWLNYLAIFPAIGETIVLSAFFLTLVLSFPISPQIKKDISDSLVGGTFVRETSTLESRLSEIFGGIVEDSLTYLTVEPESKESIVIPVTEVKLSVDESSELVMLHLINEERKKVGASELSLRQELVPVAREHAEDMWKRSYFGHYSPEGKDVGDRLESVHVEYRVAGENLALSPTTQIAHKGLMNSKGHRENILSTDYHRVGIGVIDNGYYGKMFVQIFSN